MAAKRVLRIIGSMEWEVPTIRMIVAEALGNVDEILVLEHNYSHSGIERTYVLEESLMDLTGNRDGTLVSYIQVDLQDAIIRSAITSRDMHVNERLMRGSFERFTEIKDDDIVFCVDADEVIYRNSFKLLENRVRRDPFRRVWAIPMHQLYYRPDYLWTDCDFASAVVGRASSLRSKVNPWRDSRWKARGVHGCHFSWQLTVEQMLIKLQMYAHSLDFRHLASVPILEDAVKSRKYPFDPERDFTIQKLDERDMETILPESWALERHGLDHLLEDQQ